MKRKINLFVLGLVAVFALSITACNKDNPPTPKSGCEDFTVVVNQQNNTLVAVPSEGEAPYAYLWTDGSTVNTVTLDTSVVGDFGVTVTDANGCTASGSFQITTNPCDLFNVSISGVNGALTAAAVEGTAPYAYAWSNGATTASIEASTPGTYSVTATDANGCSATESYIINNSNPCDSTDLLVSISYTGNPGGDNVYAEGSGGTAPYTFLWNTGDTGSSLTNAGEGTYSVTLTDANGCTAEDTYTIAGCDGFGVDIVKNDSITTAIFFDAVINANTGTAPFTYQWGGLGTGTESYVEFAIGTSGPISVTVTDANGCTAEDGDQF